jgi:hypothetical protein
MLRNSSSWAVTGVAPHKALRLMKEDNTNIRLILKEERERFYLVAVTVFQELSQRQCNRKYEEDSAEVEMRLGFALKYL